MLQKTGYTVILITLLAISCTKDMKQNPFEISAHRIGPLTHTTLVSQLDSIYANDSIVRGNSANRLLSATNAIEIYEKGGKKLLILEAKEQNNPNSTIENIQVIDPRYKTVSGLSATSFFMDVKKEYTISKINNTLSAAVVFIDSIQAYLTIDKKQLPKEYRYTTDLKIEASKIPDSANIKHFLISWDE